LPVTAAQCRDRQRRFGQFGRFWGMGEGAVEVEGERG
jgi:hypothetical protein